MSQGRAARQVLVAAGRRSELELLLAFQMRAAKLPAFEEEYRFASPRRFRSDFAFLDQKLLVEVDGGTWVNGRHSRGSGIERDAEKASIAAGLGYRVVRVTRAMVEDGRALALIERALHAHEAVLA